MNKIFLIQRMDTMEFVGMTKRYNPEKNEDDIDVSYLQTISEVVAMGFYFKSSTTAHICRDMLARMEEAELKVVWADADSESEVKIVRNKQKQHVMAIFVSGDTTGAQDFFCEDWPPTNAEYLQMADLLEERSGRKVVITNFIELRTE